MWARRAIALFSACVAGGAAATEYDVGPDAPRFYISNVPWESLKPGDVVNIHWRAEPYQEKWALLRSGTAEQPITVRGIPDPATGALPVIVGKGSTTRNGLTFANADRAAVVVAADFIVIEGLHFRTVHQGDAFSLASGMGVFADKAAAIYSSQSRSLVLRGCVFDDIDQAVKLDGAEDPLIERNLFFGNSSTGRTGAANLAVSGLRPLVQYNLLLEPNEAPEADNVFDGSAGLVFRYNRVVGGNRLLTCSTPATVNGIPEAATVQVYGNVLVKNLMGDNSAVLQLELGATLAPRTLEVFHNTFVLRAPSVRVIGSGSGATARLWNNVLHTTAGVRANLFDDLGALVYDGNWIQQGTAAAGGPRVTVQDLGHNTLGVDPKLIDVGSDDFRPLRDSPLIDAALELPAGLEAPQYELGIDGGVTQRRDDGHPDVGALEYLPPPPKTTPVGWPLRCSADPFSAPLVVLLLAWLRRRVRSEDSASTAR